MTIPLLSVAGETFREHHDCVGVSQEDRDDGGIVYP